jgi:hypothetical protein
MNLCEKIARLLSPPLDVALRSRTTARRVLIVGAGAIGQSHGG